MKIIVKKKIGKSVLEFEVEGGKLPEVMEKAAFAASTPDRCGICGSEEIELSSNKADAFTFIKIRCMNPDCRATANLGQYKDGSGGFWKKFEKWTGNTTTSPKPSASAPKAEQDSDDDLPF